MVTETETDQDEMTLAFLQCQVLVRVGDEKMDAAKEERAGVHVERDGSSGVHLPARYASDPANNVAIRLYVATELRRVAALLEAGVNAASNSARTDQTRRFHAEGDGHIERREQQEVHDAVCIVARMSTMPILRQPEADLKQ